tara:strand:+ start:1582 stop:2247 length:666 start_codon:yes stop_codon:yes gene_type:complete
MKSLIYIIVIIFSVIQTNAQILGSGEIALENRPTTQDKIGKYFKDVNNLLDAYKGVWQWTDGNRELTFYLYIDEEVEMRLLAGTYYQDVIYGYYVYKENGVTLIDTKQELLNSINPRGAIDRGGVGMRPDNTGYNVNTLPHFLFEDYSKLICWDGIFTPKKGDPGLWKFIDANTARVGLYTGGTHISNCGPGPGFQDVHPNFPSNQGITLTRIATQAPPLD